MRVSAFCKCQVHERHESIMGYFLPTADDVRPRTRKTATSGTTKAVSGHRFYMPETGRWLSRDPIVEYAFTTVTLNNSFGLLERNALLNVYEHSGNAAVNVADVLGCSLFCKCSYIPPDKGATESGNYSLGNPKRKCQYMNIGEIVIIDIFPSCLSTTIGAVCNSQCYGKSCHYRDAYLCRMGTKPEWAFLFSILMHDCE